MTTGSGNCLSNIGHARTLYQILFSLNICVWLSIIANLVSLNMKSLLSLSETNNLKVVRCEFVYSQNYSSTFNLVINSSFYLLQFCFSFRKLKVKHVHVVIRRYNVAFLLMNARLVVLVS